MLTSEVADVTAPTRVRHARLLMGGVRGSPADRLAFTLVTGLEQVPIRLLVRGLGLVLHGLPLTQRS